MRAIWDMILALFRPVASVLPPAPTHETDPIGYVRLLIKQAHNKPDAPDYVPPKWLAAAQLPRNTDSVERARKRDLFKKNFTGYEGAALRKEGDMDATAEDSNQW